MPVFTDMLGRSVSLEQPVKRVISLVPSQTEFLYHIGMADRIVGQTVFCVHPADRFKQAVKVGGTKKVKFELIDELQPDLIICNKEENSIEIVETLSARYPVWVSDVRNTDDACNMMSMLGDILQAGAETEALLSGIRNSFSAAKLYHRHPCVYLIWRNPFMAAGSDTFISHMLNKAGFVNLIQDKRYPELSIEALQAINPPLLLLSSEPYPFAEKHVAEMQKLLPHSKIMIADGEMFSWYGSRLLNSQTYFNELQRQLHKTKR